MHTQNKNNSMKYIKVKFLKAHPEFAYFKGDVGEITEESAAILLESGHIIILPEGSDEGDVNTLPEDLPAREILFAEGFDTAEKVKEAGESILDIKGIGKATYKLIVEFLESEK